MEFDLNADLGEGFGPWRMGEDEALMQIISSANVACGFHAGDPVIMQRTILEAKRLGIDHGAHVGFPDLLGFGRRRMIIDPQELSAYVVYQLAAIAGMAQMLGHPITLMSFHGALGNMVAADEELAIALVAAVASFDRNLIIRSSNSPAVGKAIDLAGGLRWETVFHADRAYDEAGLLVNRKLPGAVIKDHALALERVRQFLDDGTTTTIDGKKIRIPARSILVHGDSAGAVEMARKVRALIEEGGHRVVPISKIVH